jgi:subtilase family serine protease
VGSTARGALDHRFSSFRRTLSTGLSFVAADGSPYTGMAIARAASVSTDILTGAGGTSAAAPVWAAVIALADQEAGHNLGFVNPAIYRIARGPKYHQAFHDITSGNNTMTVASASGTVTIAGYQAGPGWDPVTGWGTPDAEVLVPLLAHRATTGSYSLGGSGSGCELSSRLRCSPDEGRISRHYD